VRRGTYVNEIDAQASLMESFHRRIDSLEHRPIGYSQNVLHHGAKGDGVTDDTAAFNRAALAAQALGGSVLIPAPPGGGAYMLLNVLLIDGVHWYGEGRPVLKLFRGTNGQVFLREDWPTLTGTSPTTYAGPGNWSVRDVTIDANGAAQSVASWGMLLFGYDFLLQDVAIINHRTGAILSEWGTATGPAPMEAVLNNVVTSSPYTAHGVYWNGPHDSHLNDVRVVSGAGSPAAGQRGFWFGAKAGGCRLHQCHAWGTSEWAAEVAGQSLVFFADCYMEGGRTGQVWVSDGGMSYTGGIILGNNTTGAVGIRLGTVGGAYAAGCQIDTMVMGCDGGAVDYANQVNNTVALRVFRTASEPIEVGSATNTDWSDYDVSVWGSLSASERLSVRRRMIVHNRSDAASPALTVKGNSAQTGPYQSWQTSSGVQFAAIAVDGSLQLAGGWNNGHLILGGNHLWTDSTGRLRIKSSAPTSDTDGAVVGTQT
jgi:hypothetical protein